RHDRSRPRPRAHNRRSRARWSRLRGESRGKPGPPELENIEAQYLCGAAGQGLCGRIQALRARMRARAITRTVRTNTNWAWGVWQGGNCGGVSAFPQNKGLITSISL